MPNDYTASTEWKMMQMRTCKKMSTCHYWGAGNQQPNKNNKEIIVTDNCRLDTSTEMYEYAHKYCELTNYHDLHFCRVFVSFCPVFIIFTHFPLPRYPVEPPLQNWESLCIQPLHVVHAGMPQLPELLPWPYNPFLKGVTSFRKAFLNRHGLSSGSQYRTAGFQESSQRWKYLLPTSTSSDFY